MVRVLVDEGDTMADPVGIAGDRIRSFVERIEQLDTELQEINEQRKEVFAEAKGEGFDVKVLKEIIRLRKQDKEERDEHETLLDVYMRAMDTASPAPVTAAEPETAGLLAEDDKRPQLSVPGGDLRLRITSGSSAVGPGIVVR